jgi:hypothetical protein
LALLQAWSSRGLAAEAHVQAFDPRRPPIDIGKPWQMECDPGLVVTEAERAASAQLRMTRLTQQRCRYLVAPLLVEYADFLQMQAGCVLLPALLR